jgi:hypothetical protein
MHVPTSQVGRDPHDDRVLPATRVLCVVIVPFLVLAFAVLYPDPARTGHLFAWHIRPDLTGMVLAAAYIGGAYFFARAAASRAWHTIKAGFVPICLFATLMGVSTVLHWNVFAHGSAAFWLWVLLYFTTPVLVLWTWLRNRRHDRPADPGDLRLPQGAAWIIAAIGVLALATGMYLYIAPKAAISHSPWTLSPLTARVLAAVFCLGIAGAGAPLDRRWTTARLPLQVAGVMVVLMLAAGIRERSSFDASNALTWFLAVGFSAVLVGGVGLYIRMERAASRRHGRLRRQPRSGGHVRLTPTRSLADPPARHRPAGRALRRTP